MKYEVGVKAIQFNSTCLTEILKIVQSLVLLNQSGLKVVQVSIRNAITIA